MAWVIFKVTLPFRNMCELQKQSDLLAILPQLKLDLKSLKMNILVEFEIGVFSTWKAHIKSFANKQLSI